MSTMSAADDRPAAQCLGSAIAEFDSLFAPAAGIRYAWRHPGGTMSKRATKSDFAKVRAILQREAAEAQSIEDAFAVAAREEVEAFRRIVDSPDP